MYGMMDEHANASHTIRALQAQQESENVSRFSPVSSDDRAIDVEDISKEVHASLKAAYAKYNGKRLRLSGEIAYNDWWDGPRFIVYDVHCLWRESRVGMMPATEQIVSFVAPNGELLPCNVGDRIIFEAEIIVQMNNQKPAHGQEVEEEEEYDESFPIPYGPLILADCTIIDIQEAIFAVNLATEFAFNAVDTEIKYKGKRIRVYGPVISINRNNLGEIEVQIGTREPIFGRFIQALFSDSEMQSLAGIRKGQRIVLEGTLSAKYPIFKKGNIVGVQLSDCRLVAVRK